MKGHTDGGATKQANNKLFIIVLTILSVAIIGLITSITIITINKNTTLSNSYDSTEVIEKNQDGFDAYMETYDTVMAKAQSVLSQKSVSAEDINNIYTPVIDKYMRNDDYANAQTFILLRYKNLLEKGYKQEALESIESLDYAMIPEYIQNRYYKQIVELATELGQTELAAKYEQLAVETQAAAEEAGAASAAYAEKMRSQVPKIGEEEE